MAHTIAHIENFFATQKQVIDLLSAQNEVSLASEIEGALAKVLVVASASFFEDCLKEAILFHVRSHSSHVAVGELCRNIVVERQYHTWFDWKTSNANSFFGLFGDPVKTSGIGRTKSDPKFSQAIAAFMYLGSQRNQIVHRNMLAYTLSDTSEEVLIKARQALSFVNYVCDDLFS